MTTTPPARRNQSSSLRRALTVLEYVRDHAGRGRRANRKGPRRRRPAPGALTSGGLPDLVAAYAHARRDTVTSLAATVTEAVAAEGSELVFLDLTGAAKGYADGLPSGALAADDAWRIGVDPAAVGAAVPGYAILAYARDPARVAADTAAYRTALPAGCSLRTVLRPGSPDTASAEALAEKTSAALGPGGADAVDFYHHGLVPFPVLDRIPVALKHC